MLSAIDFLGNRQAARITGKCLGILSLFFVSHAHVVQGFGCERRFSPRDFFVNRQTFFVKAQLGFPVTQNSKEACEIM